MPSEVQNRGAPILFDVRPLFGILGYLAHVTLLTAFHARLLKNQNNI